jgi:hypothetical protein
MQHDDLATGQVLELGRRWAEAERRGDAAGRFRVTQVATRAAATAGCWPACTTAPSPRHRHAEQPGRRDPRPRGAHREHHKHPTAAAAGR